MIDALFIASTIAFFVVAALFTRGCEKLENEEK